MTRRVVISGMGMLSSAGVNLAEARQHFLSGTCCLRSIPASRRPHLRARYAGLLDGFDPATVAAPPGWDQADPHALMALVAARETLAHAQLQPSVLGPRLGLVFGTCSGPMLRIERHYERILRGHPELSPEQLFAKQYYAGALMLARALGIEGFAGTVVTACTASTGAIALATDLIRCGWLDAALAGGADAFATSTLAGFDGLKATSEGKCAPFSKPYGLNLGEAAAFLLLENHEDAQRRDAVIHGEILGSGTSNDAYHCSSPDPLGNGMASAMQRALQDANLQLTQISYVNAHGTGTEANDKAETRAIRKVFGARADHVPVSSIKGMLGHCLGAAGAVEVIASLVSAEAGVYPPTTGFTERRDGCTLDYISPRGRPWNKPRVFLSNNAAFGGHNACLAVGGPNSTHLTPGKSTSGQTICLTGCGLISALGLGAAPLEEALRTGRSGLKTSAPPEWAGPPRHAGWVDADAVEKFDRRLDLRNMDRSSRWATVAARLAIREAGYPEKPSDLARLGLFLNLATGPSWAESEFLSSYFGHDRQVRHLMAFPFIVPCSVVGNVCRALRLTGHNLTLSLGPGAGLFGLWPAMATLQNGHAEAILSGAVDELSARILEDHYPGDANSSSPLIPGEGAACFLLETERHAQARGASILATVAGAAVGFSGEARTGKEPAISAAARLVDEAMQQAGLEPSEVGCLCLEAPEAVAAGLRGRLGSGWRGRATSLREQTGWLEGAQPLVDLAAALHSLDVQKAQPSYVVSVLSSPQGMQAAIVWRSGQAVDQAVQSGGI